MKRAEALVCLLRVVLLQILEQHPLLGLRVHVTTEDERTEHAVEGQELAGRVLLITSLYGPREHSRYLAKIRFAADCPGIGSLTSCSSFGISAALSASVAKAMHT